MRLRDELVGGASLFAAILAGTIAISLLLPQVPILPAVSQLAPYFAFALVLIAVLFLAMRRYLRAGVSVLFAVGIAAMLFSRIDAVSAAPRAGAEGPDFTLISFNALHSNEDAPKAVPYLLSSGADAILLLEAEQFEPFLSELAAAYPYRVGCDSKTKCDTLLLSKYPPKVAWKASLGAVFAERYVQFAIDVGGRTVTLVGAHLSKPYFDDLAAIELGVLTERIGRLKGPVILAGDFNSAMWSPSLVEFSNRTGLKFARAWVPTWPVWLGRAGLAIDHILVREASITRLEALPHAFGSNHRGLVARIRLHSGTGSLGPVSYGTGTRAAPARDRFAVQGQSSAFAYHDEKASDNSRLAELTKALLSH